MCTYQLIAMNHSYAVSYTRALSYMELHSVVPEQNAKWMDRCAALARSNGAVRSQRLAICYFSEPNSKNLLLFEYVWY